MQTKKALVALAAVTGSQRVAITFASEVATFATDSKSKRELRTRSQNQDCQHRHGMARCIHQTVPIVTVILIMDVGLSRTSHYLRE